MAECRDRPWATRRVVELSDRAHTACYFEETQRAMRMEMQ